MRLDDRGCIRLGNKVSISDYANIYSHTHSIVDQRDVTDAMTRLDDGVRITYHATVLAGVHVGEQAMVGAMAVATKDVRPYHVYVGIPAKSVRVKPNAPPAPANLTSVKRRSITRRASATGPAVPVASSRGTSPSAGAAPAQPTVPRRPRSDTAAAGPQSKRAGMAPPAICRWTSPRPRQPPPSRWLV